MKSKNLKLFFVLLLAGIMIPVLSIGQEIEIRVAPNVLNIENQGEVVTIHTDIAYSLVAFETVTLNGIEIHSWKADDRGNFVAKFLMEAVKSLPNLVIDDYNTLTLTGETTGGEIFTGSKEIMVIQVVAVGTGKK